MKRNSFSFSLTCAGAVAASLFALPLRAQTVAPDMQPGVGAPMQLPFSEVLFPNGLLEAALRPNVSKAGDVDYARLKGNADLETYVADIARTDRSKFPVVTLPPLKDGDPPRLDHSYETSFLINAHNALLLKTLADAYPMNSPDEVKNLTTEKRFNVAGTTMSLQALRDEIVQRDPRAYFALSTGTRSGPVTAPHPYTFTTLDSMLDQAVRAYVNDPRHVELLRIENKVTIDEFVQGADALFAPRNARGERSRGKWDGVKRLLKSYTNAAPTKRYFNTGDYKIAWKKNDHALNYSSDASSVTITGNVSSQ